MSAFAAAASKKQKDGFEKMEDYLVLYFIFKQWGRAIVEQGAWSFPCDQPGTGTDLCISLYEPPRKQLQHMEDAIRFGAGAFPEGRQGAKFLGSRMPIQPLPLPFRAVHGTLQHLQYLPYRLP